MPDPEVQTLEELRARLVPDKPALPDEVRRELEQEDQERREKDNRRSNDVLIGHGLTGLMTFVGWEIFLAIVTPFLPLTLPRSVWISIVLGFPIGYLVGMFAGGAWRGALISGFVFTLVQGLALLPGMPSLGALGCLVFFGAIPGIIIGWSIDAES
ncbi:MAG: hypothetical protein RL885_29185 [Planctomycetota bacterium]